MYLFHGYADHIAIDGSTSYFAQALGLTRRGKKHEESGTH